MNPTLRQLRAFVALARSGSFTLAAEDLHVTQAALSGLIRELEQTLGARVFDRSTRKVELTELGRDLAPLFAKMLDDLDGALADVANRTQLRKGIVRVAAPQLMACTLLPVAIAAYRAGHPDIDVRLIDCAVEDVSSRVLSGEVDFGLGPEREAGSALACAQLFDLPFEAVFPAGHPLGTLARVTWQDLAQYPFISLQGQFTERLLTDMHGRAPAAAGPGPGGGAAPAPAPLKPAHEVTFMTTALALVAAGLGVTVCLSYAAPLVRLHQLGMRRLEAPVLTRRFFAYTRAQRSPSPAAESFLGFLFNFVQEQVGEAAHPRQAASPARRAPARRSASEPSL